VGRSPTTDPVEGTSATLQTALAVYVKEHRLPGATAGVVHGGRLVWSGSAGFADVANRVVADPSMLHRVASITKKFTATAILQLRDDLMLGLDDPLVAHIPEVATAAPAAGPVEAVTLRLLLAHQSGFQSEPPGTDWSVGRYEGDVLVNLARVAEIGPRVPVATLEKYSNLGYQLLGEVVARVGGTTYSRPVRTRITEPLGMMRTMLDPLPDDLVADQATAYAARWISDDLTPISEPLAMRPSEGGLWSCVDDLARWVAFWLEDDDDGHLAVLAHASRREMGTPRDLADQRWTSAFGLGWYGVRKDDVTWVQHGGSLLGFRSMVCFDPKQRVGAVVLINGMGVPGPLVMALGSLAREAVLEAEPVIAAPGPLPPAYADLLGLYAEPQVFGELVRIEWRDGVLALVAPDGAPVVLLPTGEGDVFVVGPGARASGEPARFDRADDGRVRRFMDRRRVLPAAARDRLTRRGRPALSVMSGTVGPWWSRGRPVPTRRPRRGPARWPGRSGSTSTISRSSVGSHPTPWPPTGGTWPATCPGARLRASSSPPRCGRTTSPTSWSPCARATPTTGRWRRPRPGARWWRCGGSTGSPRARA